MVNEESIRELDSQDIAALRAFNCHQQNRWTKDVQRTIQIDVVDLVDGALDENIDAVALGWFEHSELIAVAVYSAGAHFEILSLGVSANAQGTGVGFRFKLHLIDLARELEFGQVFSRVHRANHPMLSINYRLGAWLEVEDEDRNFHICIVNVE